MRKSVLIGVVLLSGQGVMAQTNGAAPAAPGKEKKICRVEGDTGSYFQHKTCRSLAEWQQIDAQNERESDAYRNRQGGSRGVGGGG